MMTNKTNMHILEGNWDQIKGEIKSQWGKLTNDEITKINGHYNKLVGALKETYGYKEEEIEKKIADFLGKLDLAESVDLLHNIKEKVEDSVENIKDKSYAAQDSLITMVREHPLKTIGLSLLTGMVASILLLRK